MTRPVRGLAAAAVAAVIILGATASWAQRGSSRAYQSQSHSGNVRYDGRFTFVRMSYPYAGRGDTPWAHDYPLGEANFLKILTTISNVSAHTDASSIMSFADPELFKFPVAYLVEPGYWYMAESEVLALAESECREHPDNGAGPRSRAHRVLWRPGRSVAALLRRPAPGAWRPAAPSAARRLPAAGRHRYRLHHR
jgi:hypothetical protein